MSENDDTVKMEIFFTVIKEDDPHGQAPGLYWSFDEKAWKGPFENEEAAVQDAEQTIAQVYAGIATTFLGEQA